MISTRPQGRMSSVCPFGAAFLLCVACSWLAGCGGPKQGQMPTAQVTGQITYRGAPLGRGEVKFIPVQTSDKAVRVAYGTLDEQGRYRLGTYGQGDGAILGDYQVTLEARDEMPGGVGKRKTAHGFVPAQQPKSLIPERYADPAKSALTAHVAAGSNTLNFDLKD
jgi:hypothetical protein